MCVCSLSSVRSEGPAPRVILNPPSSPPLSPRQLESGSRMDLGCGGLTFTLNPITPPLPSLLPQQFICKRPVIHPFFSFICPRLARLLCQVSSSSPGTGQAIQAPGQTSAGQTRSRGEGGGNNVWLLIFYGGSVRDGRSVFWGWAEVSCWGQTYSDEHVCCSWGFICCKTTRSISWRRSETYLLIFK